YSSAQGTTSRKREPEHRARLFPLRFQRLGGRAVRQRGRAGKQVSMGKSTENLRRQTGHVSRAGKTLDRLPGRDMTPLGPFNKTRPGVAMPQRARCDLSLHSLLLATMGFTTLSGAAGCGGEERPEAAPAAMRAAVVTRTDDADCPPGIPCDEEPA